jgi:hypothetical protein
VNSTPHPAFEDGTDRRFRNVGKLQSDAGEIPKRIHTIFKIRRKFEIKNVFHVNSEIHGFNTRQNSNLHQPQANLSLYQKGAYYSGIIVFNTLPSNIKKLSCDVKRFKLDLGKYLHLKYLHLKSFITPEEHFKSAKS